jgi:hypothetical protein
MWIPQFSENHHLRVTIDAEKQVLKEKRVASHGQGQGIERRLVSAIDGRSFLPGAIAEMEIDKLTHIQ